MRENCTSGTARGAPGNRRSYRGGCQKAQGKEAMLMGTTSGRGPGRVMGGANVSLLLWEASNQSMEKEKECV